MTELKKQSLKRGLQTLLTVPVVLFIYLSYSTVSSESFKKTCEVRDKVFNRATDVCPLKKGDRVPDVSFKASPSKTVRLRSLLQKKPAVIVFYRGGWCPYCNIHMKELKQVEQKVYDKGYQMVAISPDSPSSFAKSQEKHQFNYQLLSDSSMSGSKAFGLAFRQSKETMKKLRRYGIDLEKASGGKNENLLPVPAVFVVDTEGRVLFDYSNPDYEKRLSGERLLAALEAQ